MSDIVYVGFGFGFGFTGGIVLTMLYPILHATVSDLYHECQHKYRSHCFEKELAVSSKLACARCKKSGPQGRATAGTICVKCVQHVIPENVRKKAYSDAPQPEDVITDGVVYTAYWVGGPCEGYLWKIKN